jgi:hypothetical protein
MEVSGQLHAPAALLLGEEGLVGPRGDLDAVVETKIFPLPGIEPKSTSP